MRWISLSPLNIVLNIDIKIIDLKPNADTVVGKCSGIGWVDTFRKLFNGTYN